MTPAARQEGSRPGFVLPAIIGAVILVLFIDDAIRHAVTFVCLLGPAFAYALLKGRIADRFPKSKRWLWVGFAPLLVAGFFLGRAFYDVFGEARPGALFELARYEARLFVHAYPEGSGTKTYRVPALISAFSESYEDDQGRISRERVYQIVYLEFPNGGRVTFGESNDSLRLGERVGVYDNRSRHWDIELTADLAK